MLKNEKRYLKDENKNNLKTFDMRMYRSREKIENGQNNYFLQSQSYIKNIHQIRLRSQESKNNDKNPFQNTLDGYYRKQIISQQEKELKEKKYIEKEKFPYYYMISEVDDASQFIKEKEQIKPLDLTRFTFRPFTQKLYMKEFSQTERKQFQNSQEKEVKLLLKKDFCPVKQTNFKIVIDRHFPVSINQTLKSQKQNKFMESSNIQLNHSKSVQIKNSFSSKRDHSPINQKFQQTQSQQQIQSQQKQREDIDNRQEEETMTHQQEIQQKRIKTLQNKIIQINQNNDLSKINSTVSLDQQQDQQFNNQKKQDSYASIDLSPIIKKQHSIKQDYIVEENTVNKSSINTTKNYLFASQMVQKSLKLSKAMDPIILQVLATAWKEPKKKKQKNELASIIAKQNALKQQKDDGSYGYQKRYFIMLKFQKFKNLIKMFLLKLRRTRLELEEFLEAQNSGVKVFSSRPFEKEGSFTFFKALKHGHFTMIQNMIKQNKYLVYDFDNLQMSPLHFCSLRGQDQIVQFLIEKGSDLEFQDLAGRAPLYYAIKSNNYNTVKILLQNNCYPFSYTNEKYYDLTNDYSIIQLLKRARQIWCLMKWSDLEQRGNIRKSIKYLLDKI